jgi:hypothetical protein
MANEMLFGITIGAAVSGAFGSAFGSARRTLEQLGEAAREMTRRQTRIGQTMARAVGNPKTKHDLVALRSQYENIGG